MPDPTLVAPVAGLPPGPATWRGVRGLLGLKETDTLDVDVLELIVNAVNVEVASWRVVQDYRASLPETIPEDTGWPYNVQLGASLLCTRLFARRNSPEGVASFTDQGAVYVQRNDPDVALLLKLGAHARPAVG